MWKWLATRLGRGPATEQELDLEREAQGLRLDLEEREQEAARLREELGRQRAGASAHVTEAVQTQLAGLLSDAATPVAQLLTQAHLLEVEGKPVQARDVLAVAKRLVRVLEDNGLGLEGQVGESVPFDPNRHQPLSVDATLVPGQPVIVRFVGVAYQGELLRKAGVEPDGNGA